MTDWAFFLKLGKLIKDLDWLGVILVVGIAVYYSPALLIPITYICCRCHKPLLKYCCNKFDPQGMERLRVSKGHAEGLFFSLTDTIHSLKVLNDKRKQCNKEGYHHLLSLQKALREVLFDFECLIKQLVLLPPNQEILDTLQELKDSTQFLQDATEQLSRDIVNFDAIIDNLFDNLDSKWRDKKPAEFEQLKELRRILSEIANKETP